MDYSQFSYLMQMIAIFPQAFEEPTDNLDELFCKVKESYEKFSNSGYNDENRPELDCMYDYITTFEDVDDEGNLIIY